jgi:hypothetical protein
MQDTGAVHTADNDDVVVTTAATLLHYVEC